MIRFEDYSSIRPDGSCFNIQQDFRNPRLTGIPFNDTLSGAPKSDGAAPFISLSERTRKQARGTLESIFLYVTSQCNSNCRTCNFNSRINEGNDLTFSEIQKISQTAPRFRKLWISGGEPFLRKDLAELIELFYVNNGIRQAHIWTNGILKESIDVTVRRLIKNCPELHLYFNFSVDGIGLTHDEIRGIPGNFQRVLCSIDTLEKSYPSHPRVHRTVTTVITSRSIGELGSLGEMLLDRFELEDHKFDIMRGVPRDKSLACPDRGEVTAAHEKLMSIHEAAADRRFSKLPPVVKTIARAYYLGKKRLIYSLQQSNMGKSSPWGMKCSAGKRTIVIEHDGAFKPCETRKPVGLLRNYGFDLGAALNSGAMKNEIDKIGCGKKAGCWCTHPCWMDASLAFNPRAVLTAIPYHYFTYILKKYFQAKTPSGLIPEMKKASLLPLRK